MLAWCWVTFGLEIRSRSHYHSGLVTIGRFRSNYKLLKRK